MYELEDQSTPLTEVIAKPGKTSRYTLGIQVPEDASNGTHSGGLLLTAQGASAESGKASVNLSLLLSVIVNVTGEQRLEGTTGGLDVVDTEVNYPLRLTLPFQNRGNVEATPEVELHYLDSAQQPVDTVIVNAFRAYPGESITIAHEWDTTGRPPGAYHVVAVTSLDGKEIDSQEVDFTLLPLGTLSRQGSIGDPELETQPTIGGLTKVKVPFINTGEIDTKAVFLGEIYHDSNLIKAVNTVEKSVPKGNQGVFEVFIETPEPGAYRLQGRINFEGKETEVKEISFDVALPSEPEATAGDTQSMSQPEANTDSNTAQPNREVVEPASGETSVNSSDSTDLGKSNSILSGGGVLLWVLMGMIAVLILAVAILVGRMTASRR